MKKFALSNLLALTLALAVVALTGPPASADAPLIMITGTVVSNSDGVLVLSTDKGNLTFDLDKDTEMPASIAVGNRITVWYDSDDKTTDKMDARKIEMAPVTTTPAPTTPAPQTAPPPAPEPVTQQPPPTYQEESTELPATASPLPLVAVTGFMALAGGLLLRKRSRQS